MVTMLVFNETDLSPVIPGMRRRVEVASVNSLGYIVPLDSLLSIAVASPFFLVAHTPPVRFGRAKKSSGGKGMGREGRTRLNTLASRDFQATLWNNRHLHLYDRRPREFALK